MKLNRLSLLKSLLFLQLAFLFLNAYSQAPEVHWRRSSWATNKHNNNQSTNYLPQGALQTQDESGEDWFYGFNKAINPSDNTFEIICTGYSSFVNTKCLSCQNPPATYDPFHLECANDIKGCHRLSISRHRSDGTIIWIKTYGDNSAEGYGIIQSSDKNYIYVCGESYSYDIDYNYSNQNISIAQNQCALPGKRRFFVAKVEYLTGNLVWEKIYGPTSGNNGYNDFKAKALELVEGDNNDLFVVGYHEEVIPYIIKVETSNGDLISYRDNFLSSNQYGQFSDIIKVGNEFFISGHYTDLTTNPIINYGFIYKIDNSLNSVSSGLVTGTTGNTLIFTFDISRKSNGDLLLGYVDGWTNRYSGAPNNVETGHDGTGKVAIFNPSTLSSPISVVTLGQVFTFDLKVGVIGTSDGGFAAVSSVQISPPPTSYQSCCSNDVLSTSEIDYWNADAAIYKFDQNNALEWTKTFDSETTFGLCRPKDVKKQECLYKIIEAPDGGLVVCGNNSNNFDDNYLAKLYGPCQKNLVYSQNTGNTVGLFGNLLINQIRTAISTGFLNYKGQILIGPGSEITLQGDWRFADSKQVGVPTGIVVYPGGKLILDPQCKLMGISPNDCSSENMWDGIQVYGDRLQPQYAHTQPNPYHGVVLMNGATIEDARTAVALGDNGWGQNGGVIYAENSTFRNNFTAVSFMNYFNPAYGDGRTFSRFIGNSFICDQPMKDSYYGGRASNVFISNWAVHGIKFLGCHFTNNYSGNFNDGKRTTGIFSIDATYDVFPSDNPNTTFQPCDFPDGVKSSFTQLSKGVEYWFEPSYNLNNKIRIFQSEFNNNNISIKSQLDPNTLVFANTFTLTSAFKHDFNIAQPRGILIEGSLNTGIFDNELFFNSSLTTPFPPVGVQANNTYQFPGFTNSISGNIFQSPTPGISSIGTAFTRNNPQIQATCNTYQNLEYDWVVDFDPNALPTGEIFADQTWSQTDPMNTFTSSPAGANIIGTNINGTPNYYTTSGSLNTSNVNLLLPIGNTNCPTRDACWAYGEEGSGGNPEGKSERTGSIMSLIYQGRYDKAMDQINNLTDENDKYFFMFLRSIFINGGNFARLSSAEVTTLIGYAKQNTRIGTYANGLLSFFTENSIQNYPDVNPTIKGFTEGINTRVTQPSMVRVSIYPNPAKNSINCEFVTESSKIKIRIFDVLGTEIYKSDLVEDKNINIDCSQWQNGIYLIECDVNEFTVTKKVVVLHE